VLPVRAEAPEAFLLDANILSIARSLKLSLPALLGCTSDRIVIPLVAIDECLITTSATHPRRTEYLQLVAGLTTLDTAEPRIVERAPENVARSRVLRSLQRPEQPTVGTCSTG
jgi:hypothetical protein